jgi:hypothetical protein
MVKASDRLTLQSSTPLVFLIALATIYAIGLSIIEAHALVPAPGQTQTLWNILFSLILTWWLYADRQVRRFRVPYEFESFAFFAWPFVVPYYLYRTRGGRGLLWSLSIAGLYLVPYLVAAVVQATLITRARR